MAALANTPPESIDDGWELPSRETRMMSLIREALFILEGQVPDDIVCSGDGWSLLDPDGVARTTAPVPTRSLRSVVGEALDEALADGWLLAAEPDA
jgi:hypothetical protein